MCQGQIRGHKFCDYMKINLMTYVHVFDIDVELYH